MEITEGFENRPNSLGCEAINEDSIMVVVV